METAVQYNKKIISNGMLGMVLFLSVEVMLFAGFISAYLVNRSAAMSWPPPGQPRLPVEVTFVNTLVLLASAVVLFLFGRKYRLSQSRALLFAAMFLGTAFLAIQGSEWARLISYGLTTSSSLYGAFFYTIIGAHALHAAAGLILLAYLYRKLGKALPEEVKADRIRVCALYWYFVAGVWPPLYALVYLM
ncbi:MAG: heme-copper oxidase subunit III [Bacteroidota bacterium]